LAFVLPGGQIAAGFRMICNILGVSHRTQFRSVRADPALSDLLLLVKIDIMGTPQEVNVIVAEAIPMWLANIHESKVSPEARETLAEFQRVAVQTLRAFFFPEIKAQPQAAPPKEKAQQSAPPKDEPESAALPPPEEQGEDAYWWCMAWAHDGLERHIRGLDAFQKRAEAWIVRAQQYFDEYSEALDQHVEVLNQHTAVLRQHKEESKALVAHRQLERHMSALAARVTRLETPGRLAAEHLGEVRGLMQALGHQTGQQVPALERELAAAFGVEVLEQLPEARWGQIAAWLHQRLGR
jgi:hypothetical protein